MEAFEGTYEGPLKYYPGCEIARDSAASTTTLSQKHYAGDIFAIAWILGDSTAQHTYETKHPPFKRRLQPQPQTRLPPSLPCGIVGSLGYLVTMIRPDLDWSYSELSKYVQFPGIAHMEAAEHVLRYLRDTWNESIAYTCGSRKPDELWGWVDADWAGDTDTPRSHTGCILMMNGVPIYWKSCLFHFVSLSTSEAEFVAASQAGQEALYHRETLKDFGCRDQQNTATEIY